MAQLVKNPPANAGDNKNAVSVSGLRRSPGVGNGNSLQNSCLEDSIERATGQATVHGVTKSQT